MDRNGGVGFPETRADVSQSPTTNPFYLFIPEMLMVKVFGSGPGILGKASSLSVQVYRPGGLRLNVLCVPELQVLH